MIGELVTSGHPNAIWRTILTDQIDPGQFSFFSAVFSVSGNRQWSERRLQHGSIALVEPLRGDSNLAFRGTSTFNPPLKHTHAVSHGLGFLVRVREMHCLSLFCAA